MSFNGALFADVSPATIWFLGAGPLAAHIVPVALATFRSSSKLTFKWRVPALLGACLLGGLVGRALPHWDVFQQLLDYFSDLLGVWALGLLLLLTPFGALFLFWISLFGVGMYFLDRLTRGHVVFFPVHLVSVALLSTWIATMRAL